MPWVSPSIKVTFGPYFRPDPAEQLQIVTMTQQALGKGVVGGGTPLLTVRTALERIAPIFGIENIDAALEALEEETAAQEAKDAELAATEAANEIGKLHAAAGIKNAGKPGAGGQPGGPKAPAASGGGGARPAAPAKT
jgi:hypothetical protein